MSDTHPRRGGRSSWILLAVVALIAIVALALYMNRNGAEGGAAVENTTAEAATDGALGGDADRAIGEAAADTEPALEGVGGELSEGARDAAGAIGAATERAADATAEGARDAAQATETVVERSTDGNPDSDGDEGR